MRDLCIDARMSFCSGIGRYIREIVPLLHQFRLILLVDRLGEEWCRNFEQIHFPAPIYSVKEQLFFPRVIPRCDLFWSPHYNIPLLPIRAKKRVVTIHDACHLALGSFPERVYAKFVMGSALRYSDRVITVSEFSKREICRYHGDHRVDVILVATDPERFSRKPPSEEIRIKYRLPERFVLFVGNHKPHKNVDGLIKAFSKVNVPGLELVMVGNGTATGKVLDEELPYLYSMAEAFVLPSFYEGFGSPPLEAMSCGCPTAVSNVASLPEVCADASLYFNPNNVDEIAKTIAEIATNEQLKRDLIRKGSERVKSFSWKRAAEQHVQVFEEILSTGMGK